MPSPIADYALIGDCRSAALVAKDGSIDWLCFPRFDSGACFAALLGTPDNGRWQLAPAGDVRSVRRRYRDETLVLETDFETDEGLVTLIDFMPIDTSVPDLMRIVVGKRGRVPMKMDLTIRFDYGSIVPWVRHIDGGIRAIAGPDTLYCLSDVAMHGENFHTVSEFTVSEGQRVCFDMTWCPTRQPQPSAKDPEQSLRETQTFWRDWSSKCTYEGGWRDAVVRSLITLKALTYAPTGGVIAAPTTSLPAHIGGERNWDYRYCWVRDATFTLYALMVGGYTEEAREWREWLIHAVAGKPSEMNIMYGVAGERRLVELELDWLGGYEGSAPVRIGNAAYTQHQLDVYGEIMDALHLARRAGIAPSDDAWRVQQALLAFLETDWRKPDEGIWEVRGPRRHFTHSKIMAWVAMDRGIKAVEELGLEGPVDRWRQLRQKIHDQICREGYDTQLGAFVQYYGAKQLDASLLMAPLVGFLPPTDPRMKSTVEAIQQGLVRDGFVDRYITRPEVDGLPPGEGAFLICTFWLADNLALQGRYDEALDFFERVLDVRNDVGLLSEEYDPSAGRLVGNFPQALSHLGLINTARNLSRAGGPAEDRQR
jgi:GH15 family glucan-1,4-alpha-glucosidase